MMETQWYYTINQSEKQGPVPESRVQEMMAHGEVKPTDRVWKEGMSDWAPISNVDVFQSAPLIADATAVTEVDSSPTMPAREDVPSSMGGWLVFMGIVSIIIGISNLCFFLLGLIPIIAGVALIGAKSALDNIRQVDANTALVLKKFNTYLQLTSLFYIIMLISSLFFLILYSGVFLAFLSGGQWGL